MEEIKESYEPSFDNIEGYKDHIDKIIEGMYKEGERVVFATVVKKAQVSKFIVARYPELRIYILKKIKVLKIVSEIDRKIERATEFLLRSNKSITYMNIIKKCSFSSEALEESQYIKEKIINAIKDFRNIKS